MPAGDDLSSANNLCKQFGSRAGLTKCRAMVENGLAEMKLHASKQQVAQWTTIAHHGASIMFGDTIIYDAQRQITLNLKQ